MKSGKKDLLEMILSGERHTKTVNTKRGKFTFVLPFPKDIRDIEIEIGNRLGGLPISSFTPEVIANIRCYVTLDRVIVEAPDWWNNLESAEDCPDDELIVDLYRRYLQFYREVQTSISNSKFRGDAEIGKPRTKNEVVGDGPFSGVAHGQPLPETDD